MKYDFSTFDNLVITTYEWLSNEYVQLQSGQLSPSIVDAISIPIYGNQTALKHCASIYLETPKNLLITPYDQSLIPDIERHLAQHFPTMGVTSSDAGVRITASEMTGEQREILITIAKKKAEEARQSLRGNREKVLADIKNKKKEKEISEDEETQIKGELQERVDKANVKIEEMRDSKLSDIHS